MLSCRSMKAPLIFVSVLMHRETNLQVENEETIEAQSARPKALLDGIQQRFFICARVFMPRFRAWPSRRWCIGLCRIASRVLRFAQHVRLRLSRDTIAPRREPRACVLRAYPVSARKMRPLHSPFTDRAVGNSVGSPPTSRMQKTECGLMRSAARRIGVERAAGAAGSLPCAQACAARRRVPGRPPKVCAATAVEPADAPRA